MTQASAKLERAKNASAFQLLFQAARRVNEHALARVRARTGLPYRAAHTSLFPHIDLEGTRQTEIARRLGISKQAVGQLVDELCSFGVLERVPDPADGRAKLVRFCGGASLLLEGLAELSSFEAEVAAEVGQAKIDRLRRTLIEILESLPP